MRSALRHVDRLFDRHGSTLLAVLACAIGVTIVLKARAKPFWHDEIYTILLAGLPTPRAIWSATIDGMDLSAPVTPWLTHAVHRVAGDGHIITRVPHIAGYLVMTVVIFHMLRRRANTVTALAGALLPCFTAAYRYSYEARPYALMAVLFSISLYAWSEAAAGRRRRRNLCLLAAAACASMWNHYYAALTFLPIAAGELVRWVQRRRPDPGVIAAFAVALLGTVPLWPLVAAVRRHTGAFWAAVDPPDLKAIHAYLLAPLTESPLPVAGACIAALLLFAQWRRSSAGDPGTRRSIPMHEVAAGLVTLLIPLIGVVVGTSVTGAFVPRYGIPVAVGISLVIPLTVWRLNNGRTPAELLLLVTLAVVFARTEFGTLRNPPALRDPFASRPLLREAVQSGSPVVISGHLQFLQYWYYAPAARKGRLRYLADVTEARRILGFDTVDRGYMALRRWTAVPVEPYAEYAVSHPEFRVYKGGAGWLPARLVELGAAQEILGKEVGGQLWYVRLPPGRTP